MSDEWWSAWCLKFDDEITSSRRLMMLWWIDDAMVDWWCLGGIIMESITIVTRIFAGTLRSVGCFHGSASTTLPAQVLVHRLPHFMTLLHNDSETGAITRKDTLCRTLRRMKSAYGSAFNIFPPTYLMPSETLKFAKDLDACISTSTQPPIWIFKVATSLRALEDHYCRNTAE